MTTDEKALKLHADLKGKLSTEAKYHVKTREDLSLAYTPGVAKPCVEIANNPEDVYKYTWKGNTVAVVSDGSAVLGLGNIGAKAAMPVMEGKAVLFKEFGNVNAVPICLDTQDTDEIVDTVVRILKIFLLQDVSKSKTDLKRFLTFLYSTMTSMVLQSLFLQESLTLLKLLAKKKKIVRL